MASKNYVAWEVKEAEFPAEGSTEKTSVNFFFDTLYWLHPAPTATLEVFHKHEYNFCLCGFEKISARCRS